MQTIELTLALWSAGFASAEDVIAWADQEIRDNDHPSSALIDLALYGPATCLNRSPMDFHPRPTKLSYLEEFAIRALCTDLQTDDSVYKFANWAARQCMGEDLDHDFVIHGYQVDHLLNDCSNTPAALSLVREVIPQLLPVCKKVAEPYTEA